MLKQRITYMDYSDPPQEVTEDFYFNFTKLELMEQDLDIGGFEEVVKELTTTEDAKKAYYLFKKLVLSSFGAKSPDGRRFIKTDEATKAFEESPACAELIISFLQNPSISTAFVEGVLPAHLVAEVKAAKKEAGEEPDDEYQPALDIASHPSMQGHRRREIRPPQNVDLPVAPEVSSDKLSREEINNMTPEQLRAHLLGE